MLFSVSFSGSHDAKVGRAGTLAVFPVPSPDKWTEYWPGQHHFFFQGESPNISGLLLQAAVLSKQEDHLHSAPLYC